jgi:hypothetical protein
MRLLLGLAVVALLGFAALHALGFRDDVAVLSGSRVGSVAGGVAYGLAYFVAVVAVPVVILAGVGLFVTSRASSSESPSRPSGSR